MSSTYKYTYIHGDILFKLFDLHLMKLLVAEDI